MLSMIGNTQVTDKSIISIMESLHSNKTLRHLDLEGTLYHSYNAFSNTLSLGIPLDLEAAHALAMTFYNNDALEELNISGAILFIKLLHYSLYINRMRY